MKLATSAQMQALDYEAINRYGIPGIVLMENAGRRTVDSIINRFGQLAGRKIAVFVGPGNNGGDGLVIARLVKQQGALPLVFLMNADEQIKGDAAINLTIARNLALSIRTVVDEESVVALTDELSDCWLVVDALFGTGLSRALEGRFARVVSLINSFSGHVVAVDVPSGINSDNGQVASPCIQADLTVTFGLAKPGLFTPPGSDRAGQVEVVDIGIPAEAVCAAGLKVELLESSSIRDLLPPRPSGAHKGTFGHLLIVAGSLGMTGAALLCGRAALKSGAGLVSLAAPPVLQTIFATALPEAITLPLSDATNPWFTISHYDEIVASLQDKQAMAIGPGIGTKPETVKLVTRLYQELKMPMVVDADALNILAGCPEVLGNSPAPRILTPHPGEMARLTGRSTKEIQGDRLAIATSFAEKNNVLLVLKGAATVIADPDGHAALNPTGNAGMATAGMGDVLTGVLASLLAQGLSPWAAACLAVFTHGLAGDRLAKSLGISWGYTASELADAIPYAFADIVQS